MMTAHRCNARHPAGGIYCALDKGHDGDHEAHRANGCYAEFVHWPQRRRGRPALADKRKPRGGFSDAEWAKVKRQAREAGETAAAWMRKRCGL